VAPRGYGDEAILIVPEVQRGSPETVLERGWRADRPINDGSFVLVGRISQPVGAATSRL